jgi:hypothetical protein
MPNGAARSAPKSKAVNILPLSRFPSMLWQENTAKVLITIDMAAEGEPRLPTSKHTAKPENLKKPLPPTHHRKIYFQANKRRTGERLAAP